ncbi:MAG TPA: V-type ATP synthase subunit I [Candidatus Hypogeohydataceae bacterium YC38]
MLTPMSKVEIIGSKNYYQKTMDRLHSWGKLHIEDVVGLDPREPHTFRRQELSSPQQKERLIREELKKLLSDITLHIPKEAVPLKPQKMKKLVREEMEKMPPEEALSQVKNLISSLHSLLQRQKQIHDELSVLKEYHSLVEALLPVLPRELKKGWEFEGIILDKRHKEVLPLLRGELKRLTNSNYAIFPASMKADRIALIIGFKERYAAGVRNFLWDKGMNALQLPSDLRDKPFQEAFRTIQDKLEALPQELEDINSQLKMFFLENTPTILSLEAVNQDRLSQLQVFSNIAQTRYTFLIHGYVPSNEVSNLKKLLASDFNGSVIVHSIAVPREQEYRIPVRLSNPRPFTALERLVSFFALPRYGTVDPTPFVSIFFPIFFGFILGDVGYGLILTAMGVALYLIFRRKRILADAGLVTIIIGACTIAFGFIYGEFFGERPWFHPLLPQLARCRTDDSQVVMNYLIVSIAFGIIHVLLGIILGIYTSFKIRHHRHALEGFAKLFALLSIFVMVGARCNVPLPPISFYAGAGTFAISMGAWGYLGGFIAPLEITALLTNILSYARLMAIGMASVAFTMMADMFKSQVNNIILGVAIVIFIHTINMVLHIFTPTIQCLRLQFVEFFTKFFHPGGRAYQPFRKMERRTS